MATEPQVAPPAKHLPLSADVLARAQGKPFPPYPSRYRSAQMQATRKATPAPPTVEFQLDCTDAHGEPVTLRYNPHTSALVDSEGHPLLTDARAKRFLRAKRFSPVAPAGKSAAVNTLKIQLGMRCNYSCSYCNQAGGMESAVVSKTADADEFLADLPGWLEGAPRRIEFWGGEPFVYFAKLKRLVPALRERFSDAEFAIVSNGSLIDEEIIQFAETYDIFLAISHDGPGQHLRGPDPFAHPERAHWLRELWRRRGGQRNRVSFNSVFTPANSDISETRKWLASKVGDDKLLLDTEGAVSVYDQKTLHGAGKWAEEDYQQLHDSVVSGIADGTALQFRDIALKAHDFIASLRDKRPSHALGQKCGMDRPDNLAVDLKGNVMTCQNTGAQGAHHLGNVTGLEEVKLTTATHWSHRESCTHCAVLQICKGSCMYLDGELFAQSCDNEYRYNLAIFAGVLQRVTGLSLRGIRGDLRRPKARRCIPIAAAHAS